MSTLKIQRDIELLEQQLQKIDHEISDPIERIEQKKQLEKKIKKLKQSKSQIEKLEQEQQELELLKSELSKSSIELNKQVEQNNPKTDNLIVIDSEVNFNREIEGDRSGNQKKDDRDNKIAPSNFQESSSPIYSSNSSNNSNLPWFNIKYIAIFGMIFSSVIAIILIINFNLTQKTEQARLQELARQAAIKAQEETQKARQEQAKAEREKKEAIRAKEEAEKVRQAAIQATKKARQQLEAEASNQIERSIPSFTKQETINLNNPQEQIDRLADRTFYSRHPELRGRKISADEIFLKQEWLKIRDCEATVDYLFYQRHPELEGRKIFPGEISLSQEWLQINRNTSGCN